MSRALLRQRYEEGNYTGMPQWFIDEMTDDENNRKAVELEEKLEEQNRLLKSEYWPKSRWFD